MPLAAPQADLFYVPYYLGLAWRCSRVSNRDPLPYKTGPVNQGLWSHLRFSNSSFFAKSANSHFFVSSRPISDLSEDFIETGTSRPYFVGSIDNGGFSVPDEKGATAIALPILSGVHLTPTIVGGASAALAKHAVRENLVAFVGSKDGALRSRVAKMCNDSPGSCHHKAYNASHPTEAELVAGAIARSRAVFCLEPHTGGQVLKNHRGIWDSLGLGCIPVLFGNDAVAQLPFHSQIDWSRLVLVLPEDVQDAISLLKEIPTADSAKMRTEIVATHRHLQYSAFDDPLDAFSMFIREMIKVKGPAV